MVVPCWMGYFPLHGGLPKLARMCVFRIVNQKIYGCGPAGIVDRSWSINGGAVERSAPPLMQVKNQWWLVL